MSLCRTVHRDPVSRRFPPLLTLRAQEADRYTWRTGMKKLSGTCASLRKDSDYTGVGVDRSYDLRSARRGLTVHTSM
jgi:hypothetical protein